jgi:hypothetical protein
LLCSKESQSEGEGKDVGYCVSRYSDYLTTVINTHRQTLISAQRAEIDNPAVPPNDGIVLRPVGKRIDQTVL